MKKEKKITLSVDCMGGDNSLDDIIGGVRQFCSENKNDSLLLHGNRKAIAERLNKYPDIKEEIALGEFKVYGTGRSLTIITYGNGLYLSLKAKKAIESKSKKKIKVIDLRWLSPIDFSKLIKAIGSCKKILIVDECRRTGCHGEEIYVKLDQSSKHDLNIKLHAAEDSFIPLGVSATVTLPSERSILNHALDLLNE